MLKGKASDLSSHRVSPPQMRRGLPQEGEVGIMKRTFGKTFSRGNDCGHEAFPAKEHGKTEFPKSVFLVLNYPVPYCILRINSNLLFSLLLRNVRW
jgi:hypothetical protein